MVWYSHVFKNFPQFVVVHTVKGFGVVNKAEIDVFLELSCFFYDPTAIGNLISGNFRSPRLKDDEKRHAINLLEATSTDPHCQRLWQCQ